MSRSAWRPSASLRPGRSRQARVAHLIDPAIAVLAHALDGDTRVPPSVKLSAAKDVLDRAGLKSIDTLDIHRL